jgi:hypothetical protein
MSAGQPCANAFVIFHPRGGNERLQKLRPTARVGSDGYFRLGTYQAEDGAPLGDYAITVEWPGPDPNIPLAAGDEEAAMSGPDRLGGKYQNAATSELAATIAPGENELPPIEVQLPPR